MIKIYFIRHGEMPMNKYAVRSPNEDGTYIYDGICPKTGEHIRKQLGDEFNPETNPEIVDLNLNGKKQADQASETLYQLCSDLVLVCSDTTRAKQTAAPFEKKYCIDALVLPEFNEWVIQDPKNTEIADKAYARFSNGIKQAINKSNGKDIAIITHNNIMRLYFSRILGRDVEKISNCEIVETQLHNGKIELIRRYLC